MSDERCACGRFLALPGGMAQIEDGVYHVPAGAPACEVIAHGSVEEDGTSRASRGGSGRGR